MTHGLETPQPLLEPEKTQHKPTQFKVTDVIMILRKVQIKVFVYVI